MFESDSSCSEYTAERAVLEYLKSVNICGYILLNTHANQSQMNRPYGAVDVAANLKGAVQKTNVQKILVALAEKGDLVQKTYGTYRVHCATRLTDICNREDDFLRCQSVSLGGRAPGEAVLVGN